MNNSVQPNDAPAPSTNDNNFAIGICIAFVFVIFAVCAFCDGGPLYFGALVLGYGF